MKPFPLEKGRVVYSKAGRDAGTHFVILDVLDDAYVSYADGCLRKVTTPKKKKKKHVKPTAAYFPSIVEKLQNGQLLDADLRKCLTDAGYARKEG